jgi:hypothetical protein
MIHTEIAKNTKEQEQLRIEGAPNSKLVLATFAISVCKIPIRKGDPHGDRKERKGTADHGSKGHPIQISLSDLCDLRV